MSMLLKFTSASVFKIGFQSFRWLLTLTCSFHFWHLRSAILFLPTYSTENNKQNTLWLIAHDGHCLQVI
jgi:hypothetical protein